MIKNYKILKMFYIFLMTGFTMHIFLLNLSIPDMSLYVDYSNIYKFFMSIFLSTNTFDISWVTFFIFIFYFYYHTYFNNSRFDRKKIISVVVAVLMSIVTILGKSFSLYGNFDLIIKNFSQFYKCLLIGIGYYFMYYSFLMKIFNCSLKDDICKKKR